MVFSSPAPIISTLSYFVHPLCLHTPIAAVFLMAGVHGKFSKMRRLLENDEKPLSSKTYRIWNEVPTVLMIIIVVMAVAKPI